VKLPFRDFRYLIGEQLLPDGNGQGTRGAAAPATRLAG
jgi:hypothetical protein